MVEITPGIYRSKNLVKIDERHGGGRVEHLFYWYLVFFTADDLGMFTSNEDNITNPNEFDYSVILRLINANNNQVSTYEIINYLGDEKRFLSFRKKGNNILINSVNLNDQIVDGINEEFIKISDLIQESPPPPIP